MKPLEHVLKQLDGVERHNGSYMALCPAHPDRNLSLSVKEGDDGKELLHCFARCTFEDIIGAIGLQPSDLVPESPNGHRNGKVRRKVVDTYNYHDAEGQLLFQTVRYEPKDFRQRQPDGQDGWIRNLKGMELVLYQLPKILQAMESDDTIYVVEGEKDADRLNTLGLTATTCPMGPKKWRDSYSESLHDARVVILPDADQAGRDHAAQVAQSLHGRAASVKVLQLPGLPDKGDVSDWLRSGGTDTELVRMAQEVPEWTPAQARPLLGTFTAAAHSHRRRRTGPHGLVLGLRPPRVSCIYP